MVIFWQWCSSELNVSNEMAPFTRHSTTPLYRAQARISISSVPSALAALGKQTQAGNVLSRCIWTKVAALKYSGCSCPLHIQFKIEMAKYSHLISSRKIFFCIYIYIFLVYNQHWNNFSTRSCVVDGTARPLTTRDYQWNYKVWTLCSMCEKDVSGCDVQWGSWLVRHWLLKRQMYDCKNWK